MTLWEVTSKEYRKIDDIFIFDTITTTLNFSEDGKYFVIMQNDYRTAILFDALTLERIRKVELTAKDPNGYDYNYFYSLFVSYDGSYFIGGDGYQRYIFENNGTFLK